MELTELKYTKDHEWITAPVDGICKVGLTDHAQQELGDIVYVELPEAPSEVDAGEAACTVESVKAASEVYSPVKGVVQEVNEILEDEPATVNESPYQEGWLFTIKLEGDDQLDGLLSYDDYQKLITE